MRSWLFILHYDLPSLACRTVCRCLAECKDWEECLAMIGPWEDEACLQELQAQVTSLQKAGATACLQHSALLSREL